MVLFFSILYQIAEGLASPSSISSYYEGLPHADAVRYEVGGGGAGDCWEFGSAAAGGAKPPQAAQ